MEEGVSVAAPRGDMDGSRSSVTDISESCGGDGISGPVRGPRGGTPPTPTAGQTLPARPTQGFGFCLGGTEDPWERTEEGVASEPRHQHM